MIFPITEWLSEEESERWLARYFHPQGGCCPRCKMAIEEARVFRRSQRE